MWFFRFKQLFKRYGLCRCDLYIVDVTPATSISSPSRLYTGTKNDTQVKSSWQCFLNNCGGVTTTRCLCLDYPLAPIRLTIGGVLLLRMQRFLAHLCTHLLAGSTLPGEFLLMEKIELHVIELRLPCGSLYTIPGTLVGWSIWFTRISNRSTFPNT